MMTRLTFNPDAKPEPLANIPQEMIDCVSAIRDALNRLSSVTNALNTLAHCAAEICGQHGVSVDVFAAAVASIVVANGDSPTGNAS